MFIRGFIVHNISKLFCKMSAACAVSTVFRYCRNGILKRKGMIFVNTLYKVCLALLIVGGLNWGLIGILNFDLVAFIFGEGSLLSRIVYTIVGVSAVCAIPALFSSSESEDM